MGHLRKYEYIDIYAAAKRNNLYTLCVFMSFENRLLRLIAGAATAVTAALNWYK